MNTVRTMEARHPCPVCLGVLMEKVTIATGEAAEATAPSNLVLDHCGRCGGVWFEMGEVQHLRRCDPASLWETIAQRDGIHSMQCHSCTAHVPRNVDTCPACGWKVELDCPICQKKMEVSDQAGLRLDYCRGCKGVWFDHDELAAIWNLEVAALAERRRGNAAEGSLSVVDALMYDPFTMYYGIHAAGYMVGGAINAASHLPEAIGAAPEMIGEAAGAAADVASSLFETIVEIISSLFE